MEPRGLCKARGFAFAPGDRPAGAGARPAAGRRYHLGCGNAPAAETLRARFPDRHLTGFDTSPAMLAKAAETGSDDRLDEADIAAWRPETPPALNFSNAALHWLANHATLMPRLAGLLAPGGRLAVQMRRWQMAPSIAPLREIAARDFPDLFDFTDWQPQGADPGSYAAALAPQPDGHPIRHFTAPTAMRPFVEPLRPDQADRFVAACDAALDAADPRQADGRTWFPFRRLFFTLTAER